jgi:hypothetical protein
LRWVDPMSSERGQVSDATRKAEAQEATAPHTADGPAGIGGDEGTEDHQVDPEVRDHYREMTEIGANEEGEGHVP